MISTMVKDILDSTRKVRRYLGAMVAVCLLIPIPIFAATGTGISLGDSSWVIPTGAGLGPFSSITATNGNDSNVLTFTFASKNNTIGITSETVTLTKVVTVVSSSSNTFLDGAWAGYPNFYNIGNTTGNGVSVSVTIAPSTVTGHTGGTVISPDWGQHVFGCIHPRK